MSRKQDRQLRILKMWEDKSNISMQELVTDSIVDASIPTIYRDLKALNITLSKQKSDVDLTKLRELYHAGISPTIIAEELDITISRYYYLLNVNSIRPRNAASILDLTVLKTAMNTVIKQFDTKQLFTCYVFKHEDNVYNTLRMSRRVIDFKLVTVEYADIIDVMLADTFTDETLATVSRWDKYVSPIKLINGSIITGNDATIDAVVALLFGHTQSNVNTIDLGDILNSVRQAVMLKLHTVSEHNVAKVI